MTKNESNWMFGKKTKEVPEVPAKQVQIPEDPKDTKAAGVIARENSQEPDVNLSEANAAYRYVEPSNPPVDKNAKK